jgi:O-antigen/teichoic acid export membrane protein
MKLSLILRSVTATWAAVLVSAVTAFFLTPFILHRLGDEAYGLWVVVVALSDYYLFLQVGVRSAIVRYVSRNLALHNGEQVKRIVSTAFYFFMVIFCVVNALAYLLHTHVSGFFSVKAANQSAFASLFLLVGIAQAFDFPLNVFEGSLEAVGRFDQLYGLRIIGMLLRVVLVIWVLERGGGLLGVGAATVLSTLTLRCFAVPMAFREVEGFGLYPRSFDRKLFREMIGYGATSFSVGMGERLKNSLYPIVIAKFLSASAVTLFALPVKLLNIPLMGIGSMTEFVSPLSSQLEAKQDGAALRRVMVLCGETAFLVLAPMAAIMLTFGKEMIRLWVGGPYVSAYPLLVLLTIGMGVNAAQYSVQSMLFGIGRHKGMIWMRMTEALGTVALGIVLMRFWGLWGYAFSTMVIAVLINMVVIPEYACKILEMPLGRYLARVFIKPCLLSAPMAGALLLFKHVIAVKSWLVVIAAVLVGTIVFALTIGATVIWSKRDQSGWWALGIVDLLKRRLWDREANLEFAANTAVLNEFEKTEEQSVAP